MNITGLIKAAIPMLVALAIWELFLKGVVTGAKTP